MQALWRISRDKMAEENESCRLSNAHPKTMSEMFYIGELKIMIPRYLQRRQTPAPKKTRNPVRIAGGRRCPGCRQRFQEMR